MPLRAVSQDYRKLLAAAAGVGFLILTGVAAILMLLTSRSANDWVEHTQNVIIEATRLASRVVDAESYQRGYLITLDTSYRDLYLQSRNVIDSKFEILKELTTDNEEQVAKLREIREILNSRLDSLARGVTLAEEGQRNEAFKIVKVGAGKKLMTDLRDRSEEFISIERSLLKQRQDYADGLGRWLLVLIGTSLLTAALTSLYLLGSMRASLDALSLQKQNLEDEIALRQRTEATLRQSQKMEAVGQLTGGIAHDFNNLLTIILGNLDTARRRLTNLNLADSDKLVRPLEAAQQAGGSAAKLTHRLLAFSRQQALEPVATNVNSLVGGMSDLLRRSVGEEHKVEVVLSAGLWTVRADRNQLENVLLNLVVNSRDAMPNGGNITVETANAYLDEDYVSRFGDVDAGQYVLLSVTDTGTGIAPEILDRIFEPFFTTKGEGRGTGLGLAMVHGFVKQSGGHIRVYSESNIGATVKIYLPRVQEEVVETSGRSARSHEKSMPRAVEGETILVVEDNESVRRFVTEALAALGYSVLEAESGDQALKVMASRPKVDLVFTDVVMPGAVNGRKLADMLKVDFPKLPVLFTTGFTRNAIVHNGQLDHDVQLLHKPYAQHQLASKIRSILDRAKGK